MKSYLRMRSSVFCDSGRNVSNLSYSLTTAILLDSVVCIKHIKNFLRGLLLELLMNPSNHISPYFSSILRWDNLMFLLLFHRPSILWIISLTIILFRCTSSKQGGFNLAQCEIASSAYISSCITEPGFGTTLGLCLLIYACCVVHYLSCCMSTKHGVVENSQSAEQRLQVHLTYLCSIRILSDEIVLEIYSFLIPANVLLHAVQTRGLQN